MAAIPEAEENLASDHHKIYLDTPTLMGLPD